MARGAGLWPPGEQRTEARLRTWFDHQTIAFGTDIAYPFTKPFKDRTRIIGFFGEAAKP
jgi:hypothetical protein